MGTEPYPYKCRADGCTKRRDTDSNHWLLMWVSTVAAVPILCMSKWNTQIAESNDVFHVCGQNHASILMARWLAKNSLEDVREIKA